LNKTFLISRQIGSYIALTLKASLTHVHWTCEHMGQMYGIGESWITSDCYQCVCMEPFGVGCCDHGSQPVDYPDWCEVIRKPDSCTSVAVMKVNHKLPCLWGQGRLRTAAGQPWKSDNDPLF
uniref:Prostate-associated microseminoprotein-like n=1 Tax=Neolamprologus brichardi TaxID=32507 RepID=A0A3Q4GFH9_NEOBR